MNRHSQVGFNLLELLILISVIGILAALALPAVTTGPTRGGAQMQVLSNMKQIHLATQQMALDGETIKDPTIGWPGDLGGSFERWVTNLVGGNYLSTNDLCKLLSARGHLTTRGILPLANTNAVLLYAATNNSPGDAVFLTSANFTNTPAGGLPPLPGSVPFGNKGFVLFHKAGDGAILQNRQAGNTNLTGSFVPLCK